MPNEDVPLLDSGRVLRRNFHEQIASCRHFATALTCHSDDFQACYFCCFDSFQDVWRVAGSGKRNKHVPFFSHLFDRPGESIFKAKIICYRRQKGRIDVQGFRKQSLPVKKKPPGKLGGEVLRISSAATISAKKDFVACLKSPDEKLDDLRNGRKLRRVREQVLLDGEVLGEDGFDVFDLSALS